LFGWKVKKYIFLVFAAFISTACATPLRIQHDVVPMGSLHSAEVTDVATRNEILKAEAYKAIIAAGVADSELVDGSIVMARVYCCGGITEHFSVENIDRIMAYVPRGLKVMRGDFIEVKVGRPPENGDSGLLNTVTRVIQGYEERIRKSNDPSETCWWDPKNDRLWLRVVYCNWMPKDGWIKQGGSYPAWYKPKADNSN
jgi:hypothetical protein